MSRWARLANTASDTTAGGVVLVLRAREVARDEAIHRAVPGGPHRCRRIDTRQGEGGLPRLRRRRRRGRGPRALVDPRADQRDAAGLERVLVLGHRRLDGAGESIDQQAPAAGARTDRGATASAFEQVGEGGQRQPALAGLGIVAVLAELGRGSAGSGSRNRWCRSTPAASPGSGGRAGDTGAAGDCARSRAVASHSALAPTMKTRFMPTRVTPRVHVSTHSSLRSQVSESQANLSLTPPRFTRQRAPRARHRRIARPPATTMT